MMNERITEIRRENEETVELHFVEFDNGVVIINTTPHPVNIQNMDGELVTVPTSVLVNAEVVETEVAPLLVKSVFKGTPEGGELINMIEAIFDQEYPSANADGKKLVILGSIIAAQAYPGRVVGMTPVPGYERVAPSDKRMRCDKFTTFEKGGDKSSELDEIFKDLDMMYLNDTSVENIPIWDAIEKLKKLLK